MIVFLGGALATNPAEFVFAEAASHVVAAFVFLDSRAAHRAE